MVLRGTRCTFLIEYIGDYADCVAALEKFLPYVNNWATCDQLNPKVLGAHRAGAYGEHSPLDSV